MSYDSVLWGGITTEWTYPVADVQTLRQLDRVEWPAPINERHVERRLQRRQLLVARRDLKGAVRQLMEKVGLGRDLCVRDVWSCWLRSVDFTSHHYRTSAQ